MSQDGYTLAEAMAALVMIGLAIGGLSQATFLVGRLNRAASAQILADRHLGVAQRTLDGILGGAGPFRAGHDQGFEGRESSFTFPCDTGRLCGAELVSGQGVTTLVVRRKGRAVAARGLGALRDPRFVYSDANGPHDAWPAESSGDSRAATLNAIALIEGREGARRPMAVSTVWAQQPAECQFDVIAGDCREIRP